MNHKKMHQQSNSQYMDRKFPRIKNAKTAPLSFAGDRWNSDTGHVSPNGLFHIAVLSEFLLTGHIESPHMGMTGKANAALI